MSSKALVVVESPAKARTIKKYLGNQYVVKASVGHVKDLPKSKMGVDVERDFAPAYVVIRSKVKVIAELRNAAKVVGTVYLAPDPDREGEAIAWHIADEIRSANQNIRRVLFNEITRKGVSEALRHPTTLDARKYESQQARRILDRLVGYEVSPLLWKKVQRGLSAGRVQSVAVRIVVEREREIEAFVAEEYWSVACDLLADAPPPFQAKVIRLGGKKLDLRSGDDARALADELRLATFVVDQVERRERKRNPPPPFITSQLQQDAARKLRMTAKRTMALAQRLYEGLDLGEEGPVGLITYMRTDSVRLSSEAVAEARDHIALRYGADYLPETVNVFRSRKSAQQAHEAIRPTSLRYDPDTVRRLLLGPLERKLHAAAASTRERARHEREEAEDLLRLYELVWKRFVACQMRPAVYDQTTVDIAAGRATLRATGQVLRFPGYSVVYAESSDENGNGVGAGGDKGDGSGNGHGKGAAVGVASDGAASDGATTRAGGGNGTSGGNGGNGGEAPLCDGDRPLPELVAGQVLTLLGVLPEQHFTQPPPRFTEASLVKELEEKGIGRPSTYAAIMSTILDRGYVTKLEGRFRPTELGVLVNDLLVGSFPDIFNVDFTAQMEDKLDEVEEGQADWVSLLRSFYQPFQADLERASVAMRDVKREETPTEHVCEKCGSPMVIKWGRNGSFLACSGYPACKNTKPFTRGDDGSIQIAEMPTTDEVCDTCGAPMVFRRGRFGEFLACSRYPECKTTRPISLGVICPREGCGGFIAEKRSKRGKSFYGCSNYSKTGCDFVLWDRPVGETCPGCGARFMVRKGGRRGGGPGLLRCVRDGCGYVEPGEGMTAGTAEAEARAEAKAEATAG